MTDNTAIIYDASVRVHRFANILEEIKSGWLWNAPQGDRYIDLDIYIG